MSFVPPARLEFTPSAQRPGAFAPPPGDTHAQRRRRWSVRRQLALVLVIMAALVLSALTLL